MAKNVTYIGSKKTGGKGRNDDTTKEFVVEGNGNVTDKSDWQKAQDRKKAIEQAAKDRL